MTTVASKPELWHIPVSHYSEKARWALDYKGVEHERHAPPPPSHMAVSLWLTRGVSYTFPVLRLDGRAYGDSTEIIAALEECYPQPSLYPEDPDQRRRALEIEDFIDEEIAPHMRLLAWHEAIKDTETFDDFAAQTLPEAMRRFPRLAGIVGSTFLKLRYRVTRPGSAELAHERIEAGLDRIEAELDDGEYLVGDGFSVADLTAAAIYYPFVRPPEGPTGLFEYAPSLEEYRLSFAERPGYRWVERMFALHRKRDAAVPVAA